MELGAGYGLILATIWTPRPLQTWLYWTSIAWIAGTTWAAFPGWAELGFRRRGFWRSMWAVGAALAISTWAISIAGRMNTLHEPHGLAKWVLAFGGYAIWSFVQQFLLQSYFLLRFQRLFHHWTWAAIAAAGIFAAAHLPNPILTPVTLVWGLCACFVFLRNRNVYPLAMAHAIFGITIAITIPATALHNMRVGLGYLRYHPPAHIPGSSEQPRVR